MGTHELVLPHEHEAIEALELLGKHDGPEILAPLAQHLALVRSMTGMVTPMPITKDCSRRYSAVHSSGQRPLTVLRGVVMHAEEASTAESAAAWFTNPASGGSTQLCCDANVCYRTLSDAQIPWGAPGANYRFLHIEEAGFTAWATNQWPAGTLDRSAFKCAQHLRKYHHKCLFLDADYLRRMRDRDYPATMSGYTTHLECTRAFGGDHTDPGTGWEHSTFHVRVKKWYDKI